MLYQTELRSLPKSVDEKLGELSWIARPVFSELSFFTVGRLTPVIPPDLGYFFGVSATA